MAINYDPEEFTLTSMLANAALFYPVKNEARALPDRQSVIVFIMGGLRGLVRKSRIPPANRTAHQVIL